MSARRKRKLPLPSREGASCVLILRAVDFSKGQQLIRPLTELDFRPAGFQASSRVEGSSRGSTCVRVDQAASPAARINDLAVTGDLARQEQVSGDYRLDAAPAEGLLPLPRLPFSFPPLTLPLPCPPFALPPVHPPRPSLA